MRYGNSTLAISAASLLGTRRSAAVPAILIFTAITPALGQLPPSVGPEVESSATVENLIDRIEMEKTRGKDPCD